MIKQSSTDLLLQFQVQSDAEVMDYDETSFMHVTPGVAHNFTEAVGV